MAAKKSKTTSATKKTQSRKNTNKSSDKSTRTKKAENKRADRQEIEQKRRGLNPQVKAIFLCAAAIIFFALLFVKGDNVWLWIRSFMFGVFGFCFLLVPFVFLYMGIMTAKEKQMSHKGAKVALSVLIVVFSCTLIYLCGAVDYNESRTYIQALSDSFSGSFSHTSMCGMLGTVLGYPFRLWFTNVPSIIISIVALIVFVMLLTGISLVDIANATKKEIDKYQELRRARREQRLAEREQNYDDVADADVVDIDKFAPRRDNDRIDIPLDPPSKRGKKPAQPSSGSEQQIIDIIKKANEGIAEDGEYVDAASDASSVAKMISSRKNTHKMSDGAKQADPETVRVDLEKEADDIESQINKIIQTQAKEEKSSKPVYSFPPINLLDPAIDSESESAMLELENNANKLIETLKSFGVNAKIINICRGPSVTRYELQPAAGVKISKITNLSDDIALNLAANGVRIEAPIPGKAAVGIEVPNKVTSMVSLRELIDSDEFRKSKSKLSCVLGRDISGNIILTDLAKMPHLLIAGTTGSGKSVCVNSLLMSILFKASPDEVKLLLIDPKMVEFSKYKGIPHLLVPVVSDAKKAAGALNWAVSEMLNRYKMFSDYDCKGIESYNELIEKNLQYIADHTTGDPDEEVCMELNGLPVPKEKMPQIVIAVDELADLMMAAPSEVEEAICRLAQMARAAGMHLIIATQRPSVNVITGIIKANIPSRIALKVSSSVDSRTIIDFGGAEKLIGRGDMLYAPVGIPKPMRVQGCFAKDKEIENVTAYIKKSHDAQYNSEVEERIRRIAAEELGNNSKDTSNAAQSAPDVDSLMEEAIKVVIEAGQASTSLLQRRLKVGYARAGRMVDDMEQMGIVGPHQGSKARDVLITYNEWLERNHLLDIQQADDGDNNYSDNE